MLVELIYIKRWRSNGRCTPDFRNTGATENVSRASRAAVGYRAMEREVPATRGSARGCSRYRTRSRPPSLLGDPDLTNELGDAYAGFRLFQHRHDLLNTAALFSSSAAPFQGSILPKNSLTLWHRLREADHHSNGCYSFCGELRSIDIEHGFTLLHDPNEIGHGLYFELFSDTRAIAFHRARAQVELARDELVALSLSQ